ncbi:UvrD-helicase domain-containing protein [Gemmatimonas sp.]|uniref:UvrD-helicase domain-containing protein n=1 Tax=Gemmatimonas sp. TaxID=1962908 RepID=UPI00356B3676
MDAALGPYAEIVDRTVAQACARLISENSWSAWEVSQGLQELLELGSNGDCCYDRPSIGVSYALWYHGRRCHDALAVLAPLVLSSTDPLDVLDIGCGTGAVATALTVLSGAAEAAGLPHPEQIVVRGVDASPFMVQTARRAFGELITAIDASGRRHTRVTASFEVGSWMDLPPSTATDLLVAGYLFDHSDAEHVDELASRFARLGESAGCQQVIVSTSWKKRDVMDRALGEFEARGWRLGPVEVPGPFWEGDLAHCDAVRAPWYRATGEVSQGLLRKSPSWRRDSPVVTACEPSGAAGATLFGPTGPTLLLDDEQDEAATPDDRLTVIVGSAGSGKSRVLAERVVRTLEMTKPSLQPNILVTAFNKAAVDQLAGWVAERVQQSSIVAIDRHEILKDGHHRIEARVGSASARVTLLNRDRIATQILRRSGGGQIEPWKSVMRARKDLLIEQLGQKEVGRHDAHLTPEFLAAELERVVLGEGAVTRKEYLTVDRRGRIKALPAATRSIVWDMVMGSPRPVSFTHPRIDAFTAHRARVDAEEQLAVTKEWTHVFVDECQDFTASEIRLLGCIPPDPRRLVLAGDEAQSMHLGSSYRRPGFRTRQWKRHELGGSYRLPLRICEAIEPLSIELLRAHPESDREELDSIIPESRKAAVSGPRPVVLDGGSPTWGEDLAAVLDAFRPLLPSTAKPSVTIVEQDQEVVAVVRASTPWADVNAESMLSIKGLEREVVIFSDRARFDGDESTGQWVYTALTRPMTLLIVVLWPGSNAATKAVLGRLRKDRLLFWTESAREAFEAARRLRGTDADPLAPATL